MKNRGLGIIVVFLAVSAVILSFIPPVQQLGSLIRLVIFHGVLSMAGLYAIYAAGILGVIHLLTKSDWSGHWTREIGVNAVVLWFVGTALSFVSMQAAWGGMLWTEPATISAVTMVMLGAGKEYLVRSNGGKAQHFAVANAIYAAAMFTIRLTMEFVMHPENPTGASDSLIIRFAPIAFQIVTLAATVEFARWRVSQHVR